MEIYRDIKQVAEKKMEINVLLRSKVVGSWVAEPSVIAFLL